MSCLLRISGEFLNIEAMLVASPLVSDRSWKKGERRNRKGVTHASSGANFLVSERDLDEFDLQVRDATEFLQHHTGTIAAMVAFPGVQDAQLDFGVALPEGMVTHCCHLPPLLIQLAGRAGIGLEISHYICSND